MSASVFAFNSFTLPTGFDYEREKRLKKKVFGVRKYKKLFQEKAGKTLLREASAVAKKVSKANAKEDKKQVEHKLAMKARDAMDKKAATLEKKLDKLVNYVLDAKDPRRKDFQI